MSEEPISIQPRADYVPAPPPLPGKTMPIDNKVKSGAGWGFVTVLVFFVIKIAAPDVHAQITPEVSSSFTIAVATFAAWLTKNQ